MLSVGLQACLNGDRDAGVPRTPEELAAEAAACIAAGAVSIHAHPRDADGHETLDPQAIAAALRALRAAVPRAEISLSTGLWITAGDVDARTRAIEGWTVRPDLVSLNFAEEGCIELAKLLAERGIGIEAGIWTARDADVLADSRLVARWGRGARGTRRHPPVHRILVEPRSENAAEAVQVAAEIDAALDAAAVPTARLHHGVGMATWAVLDAAVPRGRDIRIGLEDVLTLPDGRPAPDNAALVVEAMLRYG
jgi:uncharacterized protein (DUF849 family)